MSLITAATGAIERFPLPDSLVRSGISFLVGRTGRKLDRASDADEAAFVGGMAAFPIAINTDDANAQHYEVPPAFFGLVLGPKRKYSCCFYPSATTTLAEAEDHALDATIAHADLADGQRILELGCGWGSLSLTMAARFPAARITAVSNSASQRAYIQGCAAGRGLTNIEVVTADMNGFEPGDTFDRIVSVEMFEHMSNWGALLARVRTWLKPDGRLFLHVFTHRAAPYRFDTSDKEDWIAQHFFTGGIMPSHRLIRRFPQLFEIEDEWQWNGTHYQRTAEDWLRLYDAGAETITPILYDTYGHDAELWRRRWRLFFLATAGLFGHAGGTAWGVSHYRLRPAA